MAQMQMPPRQKMINMLYLVLTAMLAMNVSKEVLDSFAVIDADLVRSARSLAERSAQTYAAFDSAAVKWPDKYTAAKDLALTLKHEADELAGYIERTKERIVTEAEGRARIAPDSTVILMDVERKDDRDILTRTMVGSEPAVPRSGTPSARELKEKLTAFRDHMRQMVGDDDPLLAASLDGLFDFSDRRDASGTMNNWESINFYDVPLAAGIATLTRLENDVRSGENDVSKYLYRRVEMADYRFDRLIAAVISQSDHVLVGDSFRADVFLAAYDTRNPARITMNNAGGARVLPTGPDGRALLRLPGDRAGDVQRQGSIRYQGPQGAIDIPYEVRYQVTAPVLVASPTKMNVLYRHVENPVDLSVPGVHADRVTAVITNGTIIRGPQGGWLAKPGAGTGADVYAVVSMPDGGTRRIGPSSFRVRDLPPPVAYVAGKTSTDRTIRVPELRAAKFIPARLLDSDFLAPFKVTECEVQLVRGGTVVVKINRGNEFSSDVLAMLSACRSNDLVVFTGIKARLESNEGRRYDLPSIVLKVVP